VVEGRSTDEDNSHPLQVDWCRYPCLQSDHPRNQNVHQHRCVGHVILKELHSWGLRNLLFEAEEREYARLAEVARPSSATVHHDLYSNQMKLLHQHQWQKISWLEQKVHHQEEFENDGGKEWPIEDTEEVHWPVMPYAFGT